MMFSIYKLPSLIICMIWREGRARHMLMNGELMG
jgi:hypothetical protein